MEKNLIFAKSDNDYNKKYKSICIFFLLSLLLTSCNEKIFRDSEYIKIIDKRTYTSKGGYTVYDYGFVKSISEHQPRTSYFIIYEREVSQIGKDENGKEKILTVFLKKYEVKVSHEQYEKYNIGDVLKLNPQTNKFEIFKIGEK